MLGVTNATMAGVGFCIIPALLFFPAVAVLTVCPPVFGIAIMKILAGVFILSAVCGIIALMPVFFRKPDFTWGVAIAVICVGLLVIAACVWGFVAPLRH